METKQQLNIISVLYILLIVATVLSFVPLAVAQIATIPMILLVLVAAYIYRAKDSEDGLLYNHMTYMIGTIWIGSTFLAIGTMAASYYVHVNGNHTVAIDAWNQIQSGYIPSNDDMWNLFLNYYEANKAVMVTAMLAFVAPPILYFVYRIGNGYSRAIKGYRIAKPKSWL